MPTTPDLRLSLLNEAPVRAEGRFVLYWMIAARRTGWNFGLERAAQWAHDLGKPLLILEDLRTGRPWDSDRLHRFALEGMADNAHRLARRPVRYYPYVEPTPGAADGLLAALGRHAAVVVTDRYPCSYWPRVVAETAPQIGTRLEQVDSTGLLPLLAADRTFTTAFSFRAFLQRHLPEHLADAPQADPLAGRRLPRLRSLPAGVAKRWPKASASLLAGRASALARLPIDHAVPPVATPGGASAAEQTLRRFLDHRLPRYADGHNHPDDEATSGLSPYLRFGHVSVHQVLAGVAERQGWSPADLAPTVKGNREGWWGMDPDAEAFLDELVTWREIGYNRCDRTDDFDRFESLPAWARATLAEHARDPRPYVASRERLESARTPDRVWNAAQTELVREGRLHNYLRMLWGKKVLQWSATPADALATLLDLNNKYALDGRDPNSYTGIFWVLGRYDRAWGPERPVFGKIRYMTSESAERKLRLRRYLATYTPPEETER